MLRSLKESDPETKHVTPKDQSGTGDIMDALIIATKLILEHTTSKSSGKPLAFKKRIYIFSDGQTHMDDGLLEVCLEKLDSNEIESVVWYLTTILLT